MMKTVPDLSHPTGRAAKLVNIARAARGSFARKRKLAHSLPAAHSLFLHFPIALVKGYGVKPHDEDGPCPFVLD